MAVKTGKAAEETSKRGDKQSVEKVLGQDRGTYGNLEKSRISRLQKLTKKRLAAPKGLINCTSK
jgi:hypothetical protein